MSENIVKQYTFKLASPLRVDKYLASSLKDEGISREYIGKLIKASKLKVNGRIVKKVSYLLETGDKIELELDEKILPPQKIKPQDIPFDILWEDDELLVINKPRGIVVHPSPGNWENTLVAGLLYRGIKLSQSSDFRPGIVHRLDKVTSGILLVAKTQKALYSLGEQFKNREVRKEYLAICEGILPSKKGKIDVPLKSFPQEKKVIPHREGKEAITFFEVEKYLFQEKLSLVRLKPKTGRTHQLRVHLSFIGNPILGDFLYGARKEFTSEGVALHARWISFIHPMSKKRMEFEAPVPQDMKNILDKG